MVNDNNTIILLTKEFGKLTLSNSEFSKFIVNEKYTLHSLLEPAFQEISNNINIFTWYKDGEIHRLGQPASYNIKSIYVYVKDIIDYPDIHNFRYDKSDNIFKPILDNTISVMYKPRCYINGIHYENNNVFLKKSKVLSRIEKLNTIFEQ